MLIVAIPDSIPGKIGIITSLLFDTAPRFWWRKERGRGIEREGGAGIMDGWDVMRGGAAGEDEG